MTQTFIYAGSGIAVGFILAWLIQLLKLIKVKKENNSLEGFLETEKLVKDRLQKENRWLIETKENAQKEHEIKVQELQTVIKIMDEDILLLQKSNEETEALLETTSPMVHALKLKLIEANNTIARYKGQIPAK